MGRFPQLLGARGSKKWIQRLINERPEILNDKIRERFLLDDSDAIEWLSPKKEDEYAEYRDYSFIKKLGITLSHHSIEDFWPSGGPQWDALGRLKSGGSVLIEAKSHISEMISTIKATDEDSLRKIRFSLNKTKEYLRAKAEPNWSIGFYQYMNRLAFLYLLRELNIIPAYLIFVYFLNDEEMDGPKTVNEWKGAIKLLHSYLGLERNKLKKYVAEVFIDVKLLEKKEF